MLVVSNTLNRKVKAAIGAVAAVAVVNVAAVLGDVLQDQPLLLALVSAAVPVLAAYFTKMSQEDVTNVEPDVDSAVDDVEDRL